jgi:hypothetical protein
LGTDLFGHGVECDAVGTGDVLARGIVRPWREDEKAIVGYGIEEERGGFIVVLKAIFSEVDDRAFLLEEGTEDIFLP